MNGLPTVRNLAVSQIVSETMEELGMSFPTHPPSVDLADIRRKYHAAEQEEEKGEGMSEHAMQPSMIEIRSLFYEKQSLVPPIRYSVPISRESYAKLRKYHRITRQVQLDTAQIFENFLLFSLFAGNFASRQVRF